MASSYRANRAALASAAPPPPMEEEETTSPGQASAPQPELTTSLVAATTSAPQAPKFTTSLGAAPTPGDSATLPRTDPEGRAEAAFESTLPPSPDEVERNPVPEHNPPQPKPEFALHPQPSQTPASVRGLAASAPEEEVRKKFMEALGREGAEIILQVEAMVEKAIARITEQRAFFRDRDVIRQVKRAAQREFSGDREWVLEHPAIADLFSWAVDKRPLVPVGNTGALTTYEMWEAEQKMLDLAVTEDPVYIQPKEVVEAAISRKKGISDEQITAVHVATLSPRRVTVIEGTAGAGKSFTMEAVKETYQAAGYDVMGTALGWAAAKVLGESAKLEDENCRAIEGMVRSWLAARANGTDPFQRPTLLIVDEAGMVGTLHMKTILEETARSRYPVKVVLTGDSLQVVPVAAGNALEAIIEFGGTQRIDTIRRQRQASHRRAVRQLSRRQAGAALHTFMHQECLHWCKDKDMLFNQVIQHYLSWRLENPNKKALVLTLSNSDVLELNHRLRTAFKKLGMLGDEEARLKVNNGIESFEADFSVGDEVLLRANDRNMMVYAINPEQPLDDPSKWTPIRLGVFNRNSGRIVNIRRSRNPVGSWDITIDLGGDTPGRVVVNSDTFKSPDKDGMPMIHNYAGTIYGSQGQTVSQVFLIDSPRMDFRLSYVGMSRHRDNVDVYLDETELHRRLDGVIGRRPSLEQRLELEKQGKRLDDAQVELGRYTRAEMLRAVAMTWGKHSENLTATVYERQRRLGHKQFQQDSEELAKIRPLKPNDIICDFLPTTNRTWKLIDVDAILSLPDPVHEQELVRPSDVEANKERFEATQMPVLVADTPLPLPARSAPVSRTHAAVLPRSEPEDAGFFGKAFSWLNSKKSATQRRDDRPHGPPPVLRQDDPRSAFEGLEGLEPPPPDPSVMASLRAAIAQALNPRPRVEIPYLSSQSSCGQVLYPQTPSEQTIQAWKEKVAAELEEGQPMPELTDEVLAGLLAKENEEAEKITGADGTADPRPHGLSFEGSPQVRGAEGGPDEKWLEEKRGELWDIGRFGEPRILARDAYGQVVGRYRMDGKCVVGDGFPPVIVNRAGNPTGPIYLVAGAKEWLWLRQAMEQTHKDDPSKIPHIVWAAKDADLAALGPSMRKAERVVVVRSRTDDRQIPWAMDLQRLLSERQRVKAFVSPAVSEEELTAVRARLSTAPGEEAARSRPRSRNRP